MNYLVASAAMAVSLVVMTVAGIPRDDIEAVCHGARKGSIVEIANCPDMPEKVKADPAP